MTIIIRLIFSVALSFGALFNHAWAQAANPASNPQPAPASSTPAAEPAATAAPAAGIEGDRIVQFSDRIPADQIVALDAGGDKFQGWHIADLSGQPRGAVIILPDSGHVPSWPFTAAALVDDLPLHGWDTLSIELPVPAALAIEPQTQARISAAIKYFTDQNQRNIVLIGFGSGALRAAETLQKIAAANSAAPGDTTPVTALVMIAPQQTLNGIEMDLPKLLPLTGAPALDMVLDSEPQTRADAEARRRAVLHQRTRVYTRLELPPINNASDAQHSGMVKRVRAWLQKNAYARPIPAAKKSSTPTAQQPQPQ